VVGVGVGVVIVVVAGVGVLVAPNETTNFCIRNNSVSIIGAEWNTLHMILCGLRH
jgi:hypothetical protein